jgi:hypothetical protein
MGHRGWWKAYFFVALAITTVGLAFPFFLPEQPEMAWWEWSYIPLYVLEVVGLFGLAFWRRLAVPIIWQIVLVASVLYELRNVYVMFTDDDLTRQSGSFTLFMMVGIFLFQAPMWAGLYLYGFRCKELWRGAT